MSEMPMGKFLLYTTVGTMIWNTVLTVLGNKVGENWEDILLIFENYSHIAAIVLVIIFIVGVYYFYHKKQTSKK